MEEKKIIGRISEGYFLRQYVGEGTDDKGNKFELSISMKGSPLIIRGNKAFILEWKDIINLAENAGLFEGGGE